MHLKNIKNIPVLH